MKTFDNTDRPTIRNIGGVALGDSQRMIGNSDGGLVTVVQPE